MILCPSCCFLPTTNSSEVGVLVRTYLEHWGDARAGAKYFFVGVGGFAGSERCFLCRWLRGYSAAPARFAVGWIQHLFWQQNTSLYHTTAVQQSVVLLYYYSVLSVSVSASATTCQNTAIMINTWKQHTATLGCVLC